MLEKKLVWFYTNYFYNLSDFSKIFHFFHYKLFLQSYASIIDACLAKDELAESFNSVHWALTVSYE